MTEKQQAAFDTIAATLDKRDAFFEKLKAYRNKHGFMPYEYANNKTTMLRFHEYEKEGPWRKNRAVMRIAQKAAKQAAKNEKK